MTPPPPPAGTPPGRPARAARKARPSRGGRRAGDSGTREAILDAARRRFADLGYDGATIRGIAGDAGVDPALVHHFYGSKEALFAAAMRLPVVPSEVLTAALTQAAEAGAAGRPTASPGEVLVRAALTTWEKPEVHRVFLGLLRSALTSDEASRMLREFLSDGILGPVAAASSSSDPAEAVFRAAAVASQMLGLALTRYVLMLGPLAQASRDDLVAAIAPTIDRYLTGDLHPR
ncbi:MAG TPA: TetR family transcriptional regulator [Streptosporangiaceae bacterium]|jgi:AcrR family transcriptional regulator